MNFTSLITDNSNENQILDYKNLQDWRITRRIKSGR